MKKPPIKVAYLWQLEGFVFSAASTAQNSPELHFCFIDYFIQPSRVESLLQTFTIGVESLHVLQVQFYGQS